MSVMLGIAIALTTALAGLVYLRARPFGHPVDDTTIQARHVAIAQARSHLASAGFPVPESHWKAYAAPSRDEDFLESLFLEKIAISNDERNTVRDMGILGEWHIRFIEISDRHPRSRFVAIAPTGNPTLLDLGTEVPVDVDVRAGKEIENNPVTDSISGFKSGLHSIGKSATVEFRHVERSGRLRCVDRLTSITPVVGTGDRRSYLRELSSGIAVLLSLSALIAGIAILVVSNEPREASTPFACAVAVAISGCIADLLAKDSLVVQTYNSDSPLRSHLFISWITTITISLIYGLVVFVALLAPQTLPAEFGRSMFDDIGTQIAIGLIASLIWLSFSAAFLALSQKFAGCRIIPAPNAEFLASDSTTRLRAFLSSVVAAFSEEAVYRGLGISLILSTVGNQVAAAIATALLWSLTHGTVSTSPHHVRLIELVTAGVFLASLTMSYGIIAATFCHISYNTIVLTSHNNSITTTAPRRRADSEYRDHR